MDIHYSSLQHLFPDSHEEHSQAEERQRILAEEQHKIESENKKVCLLYLLIFP